VPKSPRRHEHIATQKWCRRHFSRDTSPAPSASTPALPLPS